MAILTTSGRIAIAKAIQNENIHLAWGSGDPSWDTTPAQEPLSATGLVTEVGRRKASVVGYCTPDDQGEIITTNGRFQPSQTPTQYLFFRFAFDFTDGGEATIRELGVFVGTVTDPDLPSGQMYFLPGQIVSPGTLLLIERITAVPRSPSVRTTYETVFTI